VKTTGERFGKKQQKELFYC